MMRVYSSFRVLVLCAAVLYPASVLHASFVFDVVEVTLTDDTTNEQYMVSGTITTDCLNCSLSETSLLAYDIEVAGNPPFNFNENNLGQSLIINNVLVSDSQIVIPMPAMGTDALAFDAAQPTADCDPCIQSLSFATIGEDMFILYSQVDTGDFDPFALGQLIEFSPDGVIIANLVPEPAGMTLPGFLLAGLVARLRRNRRS